VVEHTGLAHDVAEELERRRHGGRGREMIDELRRDARIGEHLLDARGVWLVELLGRSAGLCAERRGLGQSTESTESAGGERPAPTMQCSCRTRHPDSCGVER